MICIYVLPELPNFDNVGRSGAHDTLKSVVATAGFGNAQDKSKPCTLFDMLAMTTQTLSQYYD